MDVDAAHALTLPAHIFCHGTAFTLAYESLSDARELSLTWGHPCLASAN